jgi:hypothetical protein
LAACRRARTKVYHVDMVLLSGIRSRLSHFGRDTWLWWAMTLHRTLKLGSRTGTVVFAIWVPGPWGLQTHKYATFLHWNGVFVRSGITQNNSSTTMADQCSMSHTEVAGFST